MASLAAKGQKGQERELRKEGKDAEKGKKEGHRAEKNAARLDIKGERLEQACICYW